MGPDIFEETFSGHYLRYAFQYAGTERYMFPYIKKTDGTEYDILASQEYIEMLKPYYTENTDNRYVEYKSLIGLTSLALLSSGSCIMHAVAVLMDGFCWLITAPPGTGKTTQFYNLKSLYGKKVEMICGDMPVLNVSDAGNIIVHPSPWNGKERIKGSRSAPLGGILLLKQGKENLIRRLEPEEAVFTILMQLAVRPDNEEQVLQIAGVAENIIQKYPIWEMVNLGNAASSRLAAETFLTYLKGNTNEV